MIDDGSTDGSADIVRKYPSLHYKRQENAGNAAARNLGLALGSGDYFALLDQDDRWLPTKISAQVNALEGITVPTFSITMAKMRLQDGVELPAAYPQEQWSKPFPGYFPSGLMAARGVFAQVGEFDIAMAAGNDADCFSRAVDSGEAAQICPEVLFEKRVHAANQGHDIALMKRDLMRVIRASLVRKRLAGPRPGQ
ncbi:MAG: glycosyltransferase family 2 protein [Candidatus Synoicihabitans palmerolidicus]|nr:glycosyltransferase family 2 protein [Candidatus Synoicihabitans palmerolidicus]